MNFKKTINPSRGLRPTKRTPRNTYFLTTCLGAVGRDEILQRLEAMQRVSTDVITDGFPFPQVFSFSMATIFCGLTGIYEWDGSSLAHKITVAAGNTWRAMSSSNYVYLSNGVVAVVRDAGSFVYSVSGSAPVCDSICNYNGQILVGGFKN